MRFDAERVAALAETWNYPRLGGTEGERRAAEAVAVELERAGLKVEHLPAKVGFSDVSAFVAALISIPLSLCFVFLPLGVPAPIRAGLAGLVVTTLFGTWWLAKRHFRGPEQQGRANIVLGRPSTPDQPLHRLIVMVTLHTQLSLRPLLVALGLSFACIVTLSKIVDWVVDRSPMLVQAPMILPAVWLVALGTVWAFAWRKPAPVRAGDTTNLAFLVELARTWPSVMRRRFDVSFIALPVGARSEEHTSEL